MTRKDLKPGYQVGQACHALQQFAMEHPDVNKEWFERSNYIAVLSVRDEGELHGLIDKASKRGLRFSIFFEPDLKYEITAIALEPGKDAKKLCSSIGLALKEVDNDKSP